MACKPRFSIAATIRHHGMNKYQYLHVSLRLRVHRASTGKLHTCEIFEVSARLSPSRPLHSADLCKDTLQSSRNFEREKLQ